MLKQTFEYHDLNNHWPEFDKYFYITMLGYCQWNMWSQFVFHYEE